MIFQRTLSSPIYMHYINKRLFEIFVSSKQLFSLKGCLIVDVMPNSPSELAGMRRGDIIVKVNNVNVTGNADIFRQLDITPDLNLNIIRNNQEVLIHVRADQQ